MIWLRPNFSEFKLLFRLWVENIFVPVHPIKACGGKRGIALLLLRRGAGWRRMAVFIPRPIVPGKEHALSTACKAGWALGPSGLVREVTNPLLLLGNQNKSRSTVTISTEPPQLPHGPQSVQ